MDGPLPGVPGAGLTDVVAARVEVLGIRHHGPGSARTVQRALAELQPDTVVIEGPPELDAIAPLAAGVDMVPPIAALAYVPDEPRRASFYPMASFSPEWVALRWALEHHAAVRFADLPAANQLARPEAPDVPDLPEGATAPEGGIEPVVDRPVVRHRDPLRTLADAAGYDDPERWWEDAIEQRRGDDGALDRFVGVRAALAEYRDAQGDADEDTLRREAAMRKVIRAVVKGGAERVAVVCGAYHAPVLHPDDHPSVSSDNARLTGLPKTKVDVTWAPWTSGRLAASIGYGAGVDSPGWYRHLFEHNEDVVTRWMVRVAGELRREQFDAAPATVVDAVRLAETLASLRARPLAGLAEVDDAARTVLCGGSHLPMRIIAERLVVGHELGAVGEDTPTVPLARDLARLQRSLRLKPSAERTTVTLDLRQPSQLARSVLFHRLGVLGVGWATPTATGRTTGTFKEAWELEWRPELAVDLVDAGLYGTTVESAAAARLAEVATAADDLGVIAAAVESCLVADLGGALQPVLDALETRTAHHHDTRALLLTIEPLARTCRYGDVRGLDTGAIAAVLDVLVVRASVGLAPACSVLDDEAAVAMRAAVESADRGITLLDLGRHAEPWNVALGAVAVRDQVAGTVAGRVNRLLLDRALVDAEEARRRLSRQLSVGADPTDTAGWLDGFLAGEAVVLLHDPTLLALIDEWLGSVDDTTFDDVLPLLRRTFAAFEPAERSRIGEMVRRGPSTGIELGGAADDVDEVRAAPAVAAAAFLLGLEAPR